jgi:hypothetical protein
VGWRNFFRRISLLHRLQIAFKLRISRASLNRHDFLKNPDAETFPANISPLEPVAMANQNRPPQRKTILPNWRMSLIQLGFQGSRIAQIIEPT